MRLEITIKIFVKIGNKMLMVNGAMTNAATEFGDIILNLIHTIINNTIKF